MSARQQRLAEMYRARQAIDRRIQALVGHGGEDILPAAFAPPATGPADGWRDVAHANQRILWEMVRTFKARHISHAPLERKDAA